MFALTLLALGQTPEASPAPVALSATAVLTGESVERRPLPALDDGKVDFVFGLPLALRYQTPLFDRLWAEVGVGLWVIVPDVFAGARLDLGLFRGRKDCVAIRPGGGARCLIWPYGGFWDHDRGGGAYLGIYGDVDFVWQRCWTDGLTTELGLKLGAMPVFGRDVVTLPIAGFLFGVRF